MACVLHLFNYRKAFVDYNMVKNILYHRPAENFNDSHPVADLEILKGGTM